MRSHQPKSLGLHILQLEGGKIYKYQIVSLCDKLMAMYNPREAGKELIPLGIEEKGMGRGEVEADKHWHKMARQQAN